MNEFFTNMKHGDIEDIPLTGKKRLSSFGSHTLPVFTSNSVKSKEIKYNFNW